MAGCDIKRCRRKMLLTYAAFGTRRTKDVQVCSYHWEKHCDEGTAFDLRSYFYPNDSKRGAHDKG